MEKAKSDSHRMEMTEPIAKKIGTTDYIWEMTPYAKFRANPSTVGSLASEI